MLATQLGHYVLESILGEGGMGVVYKARAPRLLRSVAIKILPPHLIADEKERNRFNYEAQAASTLNHSGIWIIHDIGEENGVNFIVMELVEAQILREMIAQRGVLPETKVIKISLQICDA